MEEKKLLGKNALKYILEEQGNAILENPEKLEAEIAAQDPENQIYGMRMALFLQATQLSKILQDEAQFYRLGSAGYEDILVRGMRESGFTYETIKNLGDDLIAALGYKKDQWKLPNILFKLPNLQMKSGILQEDSESARGREAYECAITWLKSDESLHVTDTSITLKPTMSTEAVWARTYLERAYEDGCREAGRLLGLCYYYGVGREKDNEKAFYYLTHSDGHNKGAYSNKARTVLKELVDQQRQEKRKRLETMALSIFVVVIVIIAKSLYHFRYFPLLITAAVCNTLVSFWTLIIKEGNENKRIIISCASLAVWSLTVLQSCW